MRVGELIVRALGRPLSGGRAAATAATADAVVILGSPLTPAGALTEIGEERVRTGAELWRRGLAPLVCVTGGHAPGRRHKTAEAEVMARRLRELGVPEAAIRVEPFARNTRENALNSALLLGSGQIWVVTQPFHLRRSLYWFRRAGFAPLGWHIEDSLQYRRPRRGLLWVMIEYGAWVRLALHEVRVRALRA